LKTNSFKIKKSVNKLQIVDSELAEHLRSIVRMEVLKDSYQMSIISTRISSTWVKIRIGVALLILLEIVILVGQGVL
jgi:hypothetical protein